MIKIRKSMLIMGSIICVFVLLSISYQSLVADEKIDDLAEYNIRKVDTMRIFYFGKIHNLSYFEEYVNDTLYKGYTFNCSIVLAIFWYNFFPTSIRILKYNMSWYIGCATGEFFDFYYKGYISDDFVCAIQIFKNYSDEK